MFPIAQQLVHSVVLVSDAAIVSAQQRLWDRLRVVAEPAGAAACAALLSGAYIPTAGERVAVVISGGKHRFGGRSPSGGESDRRPHRQSARQRSPPRDHELAERSDAHFRPQVDGDLVKDGVCGLFIAEKLGVSQPTASEHLRILIAAGLIRGKRIKQWTFYRRDEKRIAEVKRDFGKAW